MKNLLIALLLTVVPMMTASAAENEPPTGSYKLVVPAQPTQTGEKIEVLEVFWYGCRHCFHFEENLEEWVPNIAEDVEFRRLPGVFSRAWEPAAKTYYSAKVLGVLEQIHRPFFNAIHIQKKRMVREEEISAFFAEHGVNEEEFKRAWSSFAVESKLRMAKQKGPKYGITGVPSIIVDGRYLVSTNTAGDFQGMLEVVDQLIEKVRAERNSQ